MYDLGHRYDSSSEWGMHYSATIDLSIGGRTIHDIDIWNYWHKKEFKRAVDFTESLAKSLGISVLISRCESRGEEELSKKLWEENGFTEMKDAQRVFYEKLRKVNFYCPNYFIKRI